MNTQDDDQVQGVGELRAHYDFDYSKAKPNRYAGRLSKESTVVVLDPDVAAVFPTSEEANQALRILIDALGSLAESDLLERIRRASATPSSRS